MLDWERIRGAKMTVQNGRGRPAIEGRAQRPFFLPRVITHQLDRVVLLGVAALVFVTPMTADSDDSWQCSLMEAVILRLVAVWMAKVLVRPEGSSPRQDALKRNLGLPLALLAGVIVVQLIPLPPAFLRVLSPATYQVYSKSLSGWPGKIPYSELLSPAQSGRGGTTESKGAGPQGPAGRSEQPVERGADAVALAAARWWRPVSIAPDVTAGCR
jgi:hypothetical protein